MAVSAYNFGTRAYREILRTKVPQADGGALRKRTAEYIKAFDKKSWYDQPIRSYLNGELLDAPETHASLTTVPTVDAFFKENGKQVLSSTEAVNKMIAFMQTGAKEAVAKNGNNNFLKQGKAVDDAFMDHERLAPAIIGNQCMDFHKQDGITEIEEAIQVNMLEQNMNAALLEDEKAGVVDVVRDHPIIIGCVSNFSNFLDLSRKTLRQIEIGVPCVVFSRSNTSQHMFRWFLLLQEEMKKAGLPAYLLSYLSCSIEEQRRVMSACPKCAMHFTGSREIAAKIKEVNPRMVASTGGPNTLVSTECESNEIKNVVQMSNLIENKGQCTALRQWVNLSDGKRRKIDVDTLETMYAVSQYKADGLDSVETNAFSGILKNSQNLDPNYNADGKIDGNKYDTLKIRPEVHYKINEDKLPQNIVEHWRKPYIDCTNLTHSDERINELIDWINVEQPISVAVNDDSWDLKRKFFESTGVVVYTFGTKAKGYALTAQARPQDGEVFGEFPPRKTFDEISRYPMLNPAPCGAWNTEFRASYLEERGKKSHDNERVNKILAKMSDNKYKAYACVLADYVIDACSANPYTVSVENGTGRTAYFGVQRPPINGSTTLLSLSGGNADLLLCHLVPFAISNAFEQCVVSVGDNKDLAALVADLGMQVHTGDSSKLKLFNEVDILKAAASFEFCLPFQFCARLLCVGHCKSTSAKDEEFLKEFKDSKKWLKLRA